MCQSLADKYLLAAPFYGAAVAHPAHLMIGVIPRLSETYRQAPRWRLPMIQWRILIKRLVRADLVEVLSERIKTRLLLGSVGSRWRRRWIARQQPRS